MQNLIKQSFEPILRYKVTRAVSGQKSGPNLPIYPKREFFKKFHSSHFCLLTIHHYGARFQKNP